MAFLDILSGHKKLMLELRDRAMVLTATTTAFRGNSERMLLWSDIFIKTILLFEVRIRHTVSALAFLADNAKHNQHGRVDEFGCLRHRLVELCPIGALALHFFAHFHILGQPVPDFAPQLGHPDGGEYGLRSWYFYHVFHTTDPSTACRTKVSAVCMPCH